MRIRLASDPTDQGIYVYPRTAHEITGDTIMEEYSKVVQSNDEYLLMEKLVIELQEICPLQGGTGKPSTSTMQRHLDRQQPSSSTATKKRPVLKKKRSRGKPVNINQPIINKVDLIKQKKRSLILTRDFMDESQNICFILAIAIGILYNRKIKIPKAQNPNQREKYWGLVNDEILYLSVLTGINFMGLNRLISQTEIEATQEALSNYMNEGNYLGQPVVKKYQIVIYNFEGEALYKGFKTPIDDPNIIHISLLFYNNHFDLIISRQGFFGEPKFDCEQCSSKKNRRPHKCSFNCRQCLDYPACDLTFKKIGCNKCNRSFYGTKCFQKHLKQVCQRIRFCKICGAFIRNKYHKCGFSYCNICQANKPTFHKCMVPEYTPKAQKKKLSRTKNLLFTFIMTWKHRAKKLTVLKGSCKSPIYAIRN